MTNFKHTKDFFTSEDLKEIDGDYEFFKNKNIKELKLIFDIQKIKKFKK